jgi:hypothetical protein
VPSNPYVSLVPWVVFGVILNRTGESPEWAALAGLVTAFLIAFPSLAHRKGKLLDMAAIAIFVALTIAAFELGPANSSFIAHYGRAVSIGGLCFFVFATLPFMPFTEQYARDTVPREFWDSPSFKRTNYLFSAIWGLVFAVMAISHTIAGASPNNRHVSTVFNWLVPIGLVILMVKFMERYRADHGLSPAQYAAPHPDR